MPFYSKAFSASSTDYRNVINLKGNLPLNRILIGALFSALSVDSFGYCNAGSCYGIQDEVVRSIYPTQGGLVYLEAPAEKENLNCTLAEGFYMSLAPSHPRFNEIYSTILTAMTAGKKLQIRISEGSGNCKVAYVRMWN